MFVLLLVLLCLTAPVWAASTYYVSTTGQDSHTCAQATSSSTSRRSVNQGIACLAGGDTLVIGDGIYHEQISDYADDEHPGAIRPPSGLSWSQPTTIKAANPRKATIDKPQAGIPYNHTMFLGRPDTRYLVIEGLVIDGRGHGSCIWVGPSSHIRFQNNLIARCGGNGVMGSVADDGSGCQDIQIDGNEITQVAMESTGPPGSHSVYFTGNGSRIAGNDVHHCPFYGIHATSEHGGVYANVIENNRVVGCDQAGIFSQGRETVIRNNLLENNCIGIYLSSAPTLVANNTVYGWHTAQHCGDSYGIFDKSGGSLLANNLLLQQHTYVYSQKTPPTLHTNLCDLGREGCQLVAAASSVVVDGPGGNLTLVPGGPAVGTGTPLAHVPTDRLGVSRPQGTGVDIGAYEYTTQAPPVDPPPGGGADTTKPTAVLTQPAAGQVSGTVTLTAEASDNVGIAGLQFKLDGANLGPELTQPPWQYAWNTGTSTPGPHTLSVSARDAASNFGHAPPTSVTVEGGTPPPSGAGTPLTCIGVAAAGGGAMAVACVPQSGRR